MVAAFLGILKSGAAFVPIDPSYPSERIRMTLEEAQPVVVVTVEAFASSVPSANVPLVKLDTAASTIMAQSGEDAVNASSPDDCAYIIFTSGSTGRPKGVEVLHRGLVNMATQMCRELQLGTEDTCAAVASVAFDACIVEIFGGLIAGSRIAVGEANLPANGEAFADFLERYDVTYLAVTPTSWTLLLEAGYAAPRARRFSVAEPLSRDLLRRLLEAAPGTPVFNGYGPTENTVWATTNIIRSAEQAISIGRPIANVNLYIVDRYDNLCPIGVPGEVHLGGVQVARGYLNRPELTAEKFIADRFSNTAGGRLYRTGDIGRFLPDGNVELFGRQDNQVKIRGFRIELGDVEQAIMHHPDVADCAVIARSDAANEKFLAAYLVAKNQKPLDLPAVRERIAQQLPSFMVPSGWLQLQRLPLTPGGKVDRKALPAPDLLDNKAERGTEQLSQTQELIAGIWAALLRVQNIGSNDDFFRLGGHSLLATRAIAETRKIFGIDIPLRAIFEESTLAAFARAVERQLSNGASQLEPISVVDRSVPLPLSSSQRRIWFLQQLEPTGGSYNVPYTSRLKGRLNVEALSESIAELIARHESLRTSFVTLEENTPRQVVHQAASCKLEVRDLSSVDVDQQDRRLYALLEQEATRPFDLALAPLVRAVLVRLGEAEHVLCLVFHHIVVDGWSIGLLSRELSLCYNARLKHRHSALAPLPVQYVDFAVWQSKRMDADDLGRQSTYWKEHLKGAPAAIELVSDRPRPAVLTFRGAKHSDTLPAETLASVRELAVAQGATMYMVLLAAFNVLLSRYSGQDDIVVGSPVAGRGAPGTENIVGLFINTLALRTRLVDQPSFSDLVSQVRRTVLNGLANQDLPFEKLVEEINPVRDTSRSPLFQVMFAVQEADAQSLTLDDIEASPVYVNHPSAKFDILLSVSEHAGVLRSTFEYNTDLFDAETIARFAQHWRTLVAELAANPQISTGAVEFLSGEELHEMLVEWNGTQERLPELSIHRYFERQVT